MKWWYAPRSQAKSDIRNNGKLLWIIYKSPERRLPTLSQTTVLSDCKLLQLNAMVWNDDKSLYADYYVQLASS